MRTLPEHLRQILSEPIGKIFQTPELIKHLKHETFIISGGDRVTYTLLSHGIQPTIAIVDYLTEREQYTETMKNAIQHFGTLRYTVRNPAGQLTDDLWNTIEKAINQAAKGPIRIDVDGEEDLASLAAIYLAPVDATVIYGMPNKGVITVKAHKTHKQQVQEVLDQM
jgi:GTP-dependent dephospho-CoA kinase